MPSDETKKAESVEAGFLALLEEAEPRKTVSLFATQAFDRSSEAKGDVLTRLLGDAKVVGIRKSTGNPRLSDQPTQAPPDSNPCDSVPLSGEVFRLQVRRPFDLVNVIGRGGQGEVFLGVQNTLDRHVAVKRLRQDAAHSDAFFREAFTSAQLDHPNIVPVYDLALDDDGENEVPMFAMKLIEGVPWSRTLFEERETPGFQLDQFLARQLPILIQVSHAVAYAHSRGIIHRDLKPSQVITGEFGEVYLMDWGLALLIDDNLVKVRGETIDKLFTRETAAHPCGTPAYMAPEQTDHDAANIGYHTDIYLLGAILYELLTGNPPHHAETATGAYYKAKKNDPEDFPPIPDDVPEELAILALRCLETEPAKRPESAVAFRQALECARSGSNRLKDSEHIANDAEQLLEVFEMAGRSYEGLSACAQLLARARELWAENPKLDGLRERLLAAYAETAMEEGDFALAELQSERIKDDEAREAIKRELADKRERALASLPMPPLVTLPRLSMLLLAYLIVLFSVTGMVSVAREAVRGEMKDHAAMAARDLASGLEEKEVGPSEAEAVAQYPEGDPFVQRAYLLKYQNDGEPPGWTIVADSSDSIPYKASVPNRAVEEFLGVSGETTEGQLEDSAVFAALGEGYPEAIVALEIDLGRLERKMAMVRNLSFLAGAVLLAVVTIAFLAICRARQSIDRIGQLELALRSQTVRLRDRDVLLG